MFKAGEQLYFCFKSVEWNENLYSLQKVILEAAKIDICNASPMTLWDRPTTLPSCL